MKLSKSSIILVSTLGGCMLLGATVGSHLKGVVEYSFDNRHRLIKTTEFVYRIDANKLNENARKAFDKIGVEISIDLPPGVIVSAWPVLPTIDIVNKAIGNQSTKADSIVAGDETFVLTGAIIPTTSIDNGFIQISGTIFRFKISDLALNERQKLSSTPQRITLHVPKTSIDLAWKVVPTKDDNADRKVASLPETSRTNYFEVEGRWVTISGTIQYSFDEKSVLLRSQDTFFAINKLALTEAENRKAATPGNWIAFKVPINRISLIWTLNQSALPESLIEAIKPFQR